MPNYSSEYCPYHELFTANVTAFLERQLRTSELRRSNICCNFMLQQSLSWVYAILKLQTHAALYFSLKWVHIHLITRMFHPTWQGGNNYL